MDLFAYQIHVSRYRHRHRHRHRHRLSTLNTGVAIAIAIIFGSRFLFATLRMHMLLQRHREESRSIEIRRLDLHPQNHPKELVVGTHGTHLKL